MDEAEKVRAAIDKAIFAGETFLESLSESLKVGYVVLVDYGDGQLPDIYGPWEPEEAPAAIAWAEEEEKLLEGSKATVVRLLTPNV